MTRLPDDTFDALSVLAYSQLVEAADILTKFSDLEDIAAMLAPLVYLKPDGQNLSDAMKLITYHFLGWAGRGRVDLLTPAAVTQGFVRPVMELGLPGLNWLSHLDINNAIDDIVPYHSVDAWRGIPPPFATDWDWTMRLVDSIMSGGDISFEIHRDFVQVYWTHRPCTNKSREIVLVDDPILQPMRLALACYYFLIHPMYGPGLVQKWYTVSAYDISGDMP